jgi:hypothetical protein
MDSLHGTALSPLRLPMNALRGVTFTSLQVTLIIDQTIDVLTLTVAARARGASPPVADRLLTLPQGA